MSMPPPTGNREFRNEVVRIAELTVNTVVLEGLTFQNCRIIGPAILIPQGASTMAHCTFDSPEGVDSIFWEIPPSRTFVVGGVGLLNCTFSSCTFVGIGLGGPPELRQMLEDQLNGG